MTKTKTTRKVTRNFKKSQKQEYKDIIAASALYMEEKIRRMTAEAELKRRDRALQAAQQQEQETVSDMEEVESSSGEENTSSDGSA